MTSTIPIAARAVVVDLEGTTSAAGFILGDLYDYARPRLAPLLDSHQQEPAVREARDQIIAEYALQDDATTDEVVEVLHTLMNSDVKSTPLKSLQGIIWAEGFARGEITSHFFDDVIPVLRAIHDQGIALAVFSSGSVTSQRPWFAYSPEGDLSGMISGYFDTVNGGPKKDQHSYTTIASALGLDAREIVFLSDHPEEIAAAQRAGWQVVAVDRVGEPWHGADFGDAPVVSTLSDIDFSLSPSASTN